MKNKEIFYISNLLSFSRFVLLIPLIFFLISPNENHYLFSSIIIILMWISDLLDGYYARKRNEVSEWGKIIDPLADKTIVISITIILLLQGVLPIWFFIVIVLRDLIILSGGLFIKQKYGIVLQSNWIGKLTVFTIGFTLLNMILIKGLTSSSLNFFVYHIDKLELYWKVLILVSILMSVFSLVSYFKKFTNTVSVNK